MNGYLTFLKSLSDYQQRAEIGRLAFIERLGDSSLEEDLLQDPAMFAYNESLGVDPCFWEFDLQHCAEEPDCIGAPVFCGDQCRASFTFRYEHLDKNQNLVIMGIIYIDDNQSALIGTLACSWAQEESCARRRLVEAGINPDTLETVSHDVEMAGKIPYLN